MFNERIKELRKERKLTQQELADFLNIDRTTVMKWETTKSETNFSMLVKIADFFDVSIDFLLGRKDY